MKQLSEHFELFFKNCSLSNEFGRYPGNIISQTEGLPLHFSYFLCGIEFDLMAVNPVPDYFVSLSNVGTLPDEAVKGCYRYLSENDTIISENKILSVLESLYSQTPAVRHLENIWFEFDNCGKDVTDPSLFIGRKLKNILNEKNKDQKDTKEFLIDCIGLFKLDPKHWQDIKGLFAELNDRFIFSHIGLMLRRSDKSRYFFTDIDFELFSEIIVRYNNDIGLHLKQQMPKFKLFFDKFAVQIESGTDCPSEIGLECYIDMSNEFLYNRKIELMVSWLKESWHTKNHFLLPKHFDTSHIDNEYDIITENCHFIPKRMTTWLHHIKFSISSDGIRKVKAYIAFENEWIKSV